MKNLDSIHYASQAPELQDVCLSVFNECDKVDLSVDPYTFSILGEGKSINLDLSKAIDRIKEKSGKKEHGDSRNSAYRGVFYMMKGIEQGASEELKPAISTVSRILNQYGLKLLSKGYSTQNAKIRSMLIDLASPEAVAASAKLPGLDTKIEALKKEQDEFMKCSEAFENSKAEVGQKKSATELKDDLLHLMNKKFIPCLRHIASAQPALYEGMVNNIAQLVFDHNVLVKKRNNKPEVD